MELLRLYSVIAYNTMLRGWKTPKNAPDLGRYIDVPLGSSI